MPFSIWVQLDGQDKEVACRLQAPRVGDSTLTASMSRREEPDRSAIAADALALAEEAEAEAVEAEAIAAAARAKARAIRLRSARQQAAGGDAAR